MLLVVQDLSVQRVGQTVVVQHHLVARQVAFRVGECHLDAVAVPAGPGVLVGVVPDLDAEEDSGRVPTKCEGHCEVLTLRGGRVRPSVVLLELSPRRPRCVLVRCPERCLRQDRHAAPVVEVTVQDNVRRVCRVDEVGDLDGADGGVPCRRVRLPVFEAGRGRGRSGRGKGEVADQRD